MPTCRWCGRIEARHRCTECGSPRLRAIVLGSERTAEEMGRAFPNTRVVVSGGNKVLDAVDYPGLRAEQAKKRAEEAKNGVEIAYHMPRVGAQMWFDSFAIPAEVLE